MPQNPVEIKTWSWWNYFIFRSRACPQCIDIQINFVPQLLSLSTQFASTYLHFFLHSFTHLVSNNPHTHCLHNGNINRVVVTQPQFHFQTHSLDRSCAFESCKFAKWKIKFCILFTTRSRSRRSCVEVSMKIKTKIKNCFTFFLSFLLRFLIEKLRNNWKIFLW